MRPLTVISLNWMLARGCWPPAPQFNVEVIGCAASSGRLASGLNIALSTLNWGGAGAAQVQVHADERYFRTRRTGLSGTQLLLKLIAGHAARSKHVI